MHIGPITNTRKSSEPARDDTDFHIMQAFARNPSIEAAQWGRLREVIGNWGAVLLTAPIAIYLFSRQGAVLLLVTDWGAA